MASPLLSADGDGISADLASRRILLVTGLAGQLEKTLLVSSRGCEEIEKCFSEAGRTVVKVGDGAEAVEKARREFFDSVLILSTGKTMDLAETVFNLRDVSAAMEIIMVVDWADASGNLMVRIAKSVPNTMVLNFQGLRYLLQVAEPGPRKGQNKDPVAKKRI